MADGGAFDIDTGNVRNTVRGNFGHDTAGYCVSVFGAYGPTTDSVVADNLCLNNGMSPRLAQRQGAILLMTWQGGSLDGVEIHGNRIHWKAAGDTPAVRAGEDLQATRVVLRSNEILSSGLTFVDSLLIYAGNHNHYEIASNDSVDLSAAMPAFTALHESGSTLTADGSDATRTGLSGLATTGGSGWRLELRAPGGLLGGGGSDILRGTLVQMRSAALQYGHGGLKVTIRGDTSSTALARDRSLPGDGIVLDIQPSKDVSAFLLRLIAPNGHVVREWHTFPTPVDLGLTLRQNVGPPDFSRLSFEHVSATD